MNLNKEKFILGYLAVMASADNIGKAQWGTASMYEGSRQEDENRILITVLDNSIKHCFHQEKGNTVHVAFRKIVFWVRFKRFCKLLFVFGKGSVCCPRPKSPVKIEEAHLHPISMETLGEDRQCSKNCILDYFA